MRTNEKHLFINLKNMKIMVKSIKRILLNAVFVAISTVAAAQQVDVSGVVKDANGEPVIGATVTEEGTKNATVTDFDGKFRLKVTGGVKN